MLKSPALYRDRRPRQSRGNGAEGECRSKPGHTRSRAFYQMKLVHPHSGKELEGFTRVGSGDRQRGAVMLSSTDRTISASRGTLTGDILWLATITFCFRDRHRNGGLNSFRQPTETGPTGASRSYTEFGGGHRANFRGISSCSGSASSKAAGRGDYSMVESAPRRGDRPTRKNSRGDRQSI